MSTTRRAFVRALGATGAAVAAAPALAKVAACLPPASAQLPAQALEAATGAVVPIGTPVVSFFMDQPYLDYSGQAVPYVPPAGMRSAQSLADREYPFLSC
jgi:hypothetical protein